MEKIKNLKEIFNLFGLSERDYLVYLSILKNKNISATDISKETKIYRTNVYDSLKILESRLLISKISLKDKSTYKPSNPEIFREIFNLKVLEVEEFIKESKKILNEPTKEKTKFYTSDNVHIFWEFISEALNKKSEILIYGYSESMQEDIPKEIREKLMKERVNNKIPVRVLTDDFSKEKLINFNKLSFTKAKNIPLQIKDKNGFMRIISGNKVYLVFWEQPVKTIIIENESLAEHHRKLFDILWNL